MSLKNFLKEILDLHIKYPVINRKQLIPVFPQAPNRLKKVVFAHNTSSFITSNNPEFTT